MRHAPESARRMWRPILLVAFGLMEWTSGATQVTPESVCPTCVTRAGDEGPAGGAAASSLACDGESAPLTPAAEKAFGLEQLREFLAGPNRVEGYFAEGEQSATTIEFSFDLPLDELLVGVDTTGVSGASLHGRVPVRTLNEGQAQALGSAVDVLDTWVSYDFAMDPPRLSGLVDLLNEFQPGNYTRTNCLAFPTGDIQDTEECRYER